MSEQKSTGAQRHSDLILLLLAAGVLIAGGQWMGAMLHNQQERSFHIVLRTVNSQAETMRAAGRTEAEVAETLAPFRRAAFRILGRQYSNTLDIMQGLGVALIISAGVIFVRRRHPSLIRLGSL